MASVSTQAPATPHQPSRKGKKAWRKNVDITEVQQGLEAVRDEIIKGGVISEKAADQLFTSDLNGDEQISKKHSTKKLLKVDEILAQRSPVPGLDGRKRKADTTLASLSTTGKKSRNTPYITHKTLTHLRNVADNQSTNLISTNDTPTHDPWAAPPPDPNAHLTFLPQPKPTVQPATLSLAPQPLTTSGRSVPHIAKPAAGKSYNPLAQDWTTLLESEGAAAVAAEQKRLAHEAAIAEREARALEIAAKVEEAEREEYATDYESEWEGFGDEDGKEVHTVKMARRKTPAERNKVKARKVREGLERHETAMRKREEVEKRLGDVLKGEREGRERELRDSQLVVEESEGKDGEEEGVGGVRVRKGRFGKLSVPEAPLEVVLPEDLQDSLRRLKPEGNLLTDRYRNLLINGKLEVRKKVGQVKKKQVTRTEKWSYKDWKLR